MKIHTCTSSIYHVYFYIYSHCLFNDFFQVKLLNWICKARNVSHFAVILTGNTDYYHHQHITHNYSSKQPDNYIYLPKGTVNKRRVWETGWSFLTQTQGDTASLRFINLIQSSVNGLIVTISHTKIGREHLWIQCGTHKDHFQVRPENKNGKQKLGGSQTISTIYGYQ